MSLIRALSRPLVFAFGLQLLACAPALNWREVTVAETPLRLQLPCRAHAQERTLQLAGQRVLWRMLVCSAGDQDRKSVV